MIKLSILMVRRPELTYEQFMQHWREIHAPLFAAQPETKRYVRRYIQDHVTGNKLPGATASDYDGIAEIWFDDITRARAFFESDGYIQNIIPDEEAFMDRKHCAFMWTTEHSVAL
jgi:uncharacterized protein (TIGR02118 family)